VAVQGVSSIARPQRSLPLWQRTQGQAVLWDRKQLRLTAVRWPDRLIFAALAAAIAANAVLRWLGYQ
jgi:hypothetical protein